MSMDLDKIEGKIGRAVAGTTEVSMSLGGVQIKDLGQLLEISKMMSIAGVAVPYHLRGNPGACLAVAMRALRNGFDPFELAEHSYTMKKSQKGPDGRWEDVETIAFDSFVIRAIIDAHANLTGLIRYTYEGEGDETVCIAMCKPPGEKEPLVHRSPTLGALKAARGRNDKGAIKGSPLWETKPEQQMAYDTGRDLCRRYFPAVLLGWHDRDEMDENVPPGRVVEPVKTSGLRSRLSKPKEDQRGFNAEAINKTIDGEVAKRDTPDKNGASAPPVQAAPVPAPEEVPATPRLETSGADDLIEASAGKTSASPDDQSEPVSPDLTGGAASHASPPETEPKPAMVAYQEAGEPGPPFNGTYKEGKPVDSKPEKYVPPMPPKDGPDYVRYVREMLTIPGMHEEAEVRRWYSSPYEKKLRNSLLNITGEIIDEAKALVIAHIKTITEGEQT